MSSTTSTFSLPTLRIRSHDLHRPLPDILIVDIGDRYAVLDAIQREVAKLVAIVRIRKRLASMYPGCEFLLPTRTDEGWITRIRFDRKTVFAEHRNCWEAYHKLVEEAVKRIL